MDNFTQVPPLALFGNPNGYLAAAETITGRSEGQVLQILNNRIQFETIAAGAGGGIAISANGGAITSGTALFSNLNGISIGRAGQTITFSHNGLTTARASNDGIGLATAQSNVTWTVNSAGLSLNAIGYAGTGTTFTNVTATLNSNGLQMNAAGYAGTGTSATNASLTLNSNGLAISVAAPGGGGGATLSTFFSPDILFTTVGAPINASASISRFLVPFNVTGTRFDIAASINVATAANNSSAAYLYSCSFVLYTINGNTLNSVSSGSGANTVTWSSNATGSATGVRFISGTINVNLTPGQYYAAIQLSTRATGHAGAATTSLANTFSMMGVGSAVNGAFSIAEMGAATNSTNNWFDNGMYSGTTNLTQVSMSAVSNAGTLGNRAAVGVRIIA